MKKTGFAIWRQTLIFVTQNGNVQGTTWYPCHAETEYISDEQAAAHLKNADLELLSNGADTERYYPKK